MRTNDNPPERRWKTSRTWLATSAVVALGASGLAATSASAAPPDDTWYSSPAAGLHRFIMPNAAAIEAAGTTPVRVELEGNFGPSGAIGRFDMGLSGANRSSTLGPLEPGLYHYRYVATIGGTGELVEFRNPASPQTVTSQPAWNTFFVEGAEVAWMADVAGGGQLETIMYDSTVAGAERSALVWTPPGYDEDRAEAYPVLYLLSGDGQSYREWAELGRAKQVLDNLAVDGDLEPMVVVMADAGASDAQAEVLDNIVPAAEEAFNVSDDPADRAVAGVGRGAAQALDLLLTDPGEFANVGSFSGSLEGGVSAAEAAQINAGTDLVRLYVGNTLDPSYNANVSLVDAFTTAGVEFEFDGVNPESGGTWESWRENLRDFASRVFQDDVDGGPSEGHRALEGMHSLPAPGTTPTPWVDEHGMVTFETGTEYADATTVTLWGNFGPAGSWPRMPMVKVGDRWRLTVGPVDGGSYYYRFVVDGVDRPDTSNPRTVVSEPNWRMFQVEGPGLRGEFTSDVAEEHRGEVTVMNYTSTAGEQARTAYVWTPPDYDPDREEPYPVFFLQHGGGQTWADWIEVGRAAQILDNHLLRGNIVPMVVVMANGNGVNFPNELFQRIVPAAEEGYNISSDLDERAIAGLSLGSGHAMSVLYGFPGEFGYVGAFSAFSPPPASADAEAINAGTRLLRVYSGDIQDFTYQPTLSMIAGLTARGINHEFAPIIPGPHSWDVWQKALIDFLPRLFVDSINDAEVSVETGTRCVAGRVVQVLRVTNDSDAPAEVELSSAYGARTVTVGAERATSLTFSARLASVPAGVVAVTATADGYEEMAATVVHTARTCG